MDHEPDEEFVEGQSSLARPPLSYPQADTTQPQLGNGSESSPYGQPPASYSPMPVAPGVPQYHQVAPKSPGVSLLASFFIPGLGSMINGDVGKGVGILVGYIVSAVLVLVLVGIIGVIGFWIWGMIDAYQGAQKWNAAHGILS